MARVVRSRRLLPLASACAVVLTACSSEPAPASDADGAADRSAGAATATTDPDLTHVDGLGAIAFPTSGAPEAQPHFIRGVLLLHSFEYGGAADAFRAAQEADPDFAMAYWGEAMTYNHPLWQEKDVEAAREVLERLDPDPEARAAKAGTERERMYLAAVEALFGDGTKQEQDDAYAAAMRALHEAYPDDDEARAFLALGVLGTENGVRDFETYEAAAEIAKPVFAGNPDHPGAAHYIIHSYDDPVHAPQGLEAARAYSEIAPEAAHAQHMTSHIFVAMGMWDDVVLANERAMAVQDAQRAERGLPPNACGHYSSWLHYGHLMLGNLDEAETLMDACHEARVQRPGQTSAAYFVLMRARHLLDSGDPSVVGRWEAELGDEGTFVSGRAGLVYDFTDAFVALRAGDPAPARALLAEPEAENDAERIHLQMVRGMLAIHDGDTEEGIETLRAAAEAEDALPFQFGPPAIVKPTFELLGEELLALGRTEEARAAFQRALERTPGRTAAVEGLEAAGG